MMNAGGIFKNAFLKDTHLYSTATNLILAAIESCIAYGYLVSARNIQGDGMHGWALEVISRRNLHKCIKRFFFSVKREEKLLPKSDNWFYVCFIILPFYSQ